MYEEAFMNAFSILFSESYKDSNIRDLSKERTLASMPYGCRYRLIDFILSSLVNSQIYSVGILTKNNYGSLIDHLREGKDWDMDRKNDRLRILTPFVQDANMAYSNSKIEALLSVRNYLESMQKEYCILADCNVIFNIDFDDVIECHERKNADITIVYRSAKEVTDAMAIECDLGGKVTGTRFVARNSAKYNDISMNIYVLKKDLLLKILDSSISYGFHDLEREIIARNVNTMNIFAYKHIGYSSVINSVAGYYKANMELLDRNIRTELFSSDTTILTKIMNMTPTIYQRNCKMKNTLVGDGAVIDGHVENSIIFRGVKIQKGAYVKDSIIMQDTVIGQNAIVENAICDKSVKICDGAEIKGTKKYPFVIRKNEIIEKD